MPLSQLGESDRVESTRLDRVHWPIWIELGWAGLGGHRQDWRTRTRLVDSWTQEWLGGCERGEWAPNKPPVPIFGKCQ